MFSPVVAVHCGVGLYDAKSYEASQLLLKHQLLRAQQLLNEADNSALDVCAAVCCGLEDSALTNAGVGSNLTNQGTVELDASLAISEPALTAAVGALPGFRNPIMVAKKIVDLQMRHRKGDLTAPCFLAGSSATEWCLKNGFRPFEGLITEESRQGYFKALEVVERKEAAMMDGELDCVTSKKKLGLGTIGAVVLDAKGLVCSGTSSGGVILKEPGRIGSSAVVGAGCWAEKDQDCRVGVTASGQGEVLMRKLFTSRLSCDILTKQSEWKPLASEFHQSFLKLCPGSGDETVGCVCVRSFQDQETEVCWTTSQFSFVAGAVGCVGYPFVELNCPLSENNISKPSVSCHIFAL